MEEVIMEKIQSEKFNNGTVTVWFYIDNIRYYDKNQKLIEKNDQFVCYFKFSEPTILCLGELVKNLKNEIVILNTSSNTLSNAINYVKTKFKFKE
jgi:hypothetical protein